jgi:eukaryotic-like serine/threonine-protein kinase
MIPDDDKTQAVTVLSKGTVINHYRIVERIGAGGMGEVYLAEDTKLNRNVALKFLSQHLCQDEACRQRFEREAQAAAKLGHANIVAVYEVGEHKGRPFFAMELVEGRSLDKIIAAGRLDEGEIIGLALGICNGLRKAHESGVIHRDIKPSNIIVDRDGVPRVLDFGLAAVCDSDSLTHTGSTLGTIGYMSPEQISGQGADVRSDLFSMGIVLYEMISGINPFRRDNQAATLKAIVDDIPVPLANSRTGISNELQRIVSKLLGKKPEHRYQTAADAISDMKSLIATGQLLTDTQARTNRLAVLPFQNLSNDPEQEYFNDGLTEELITTLSKVKSICVISRSSVMTFKGSRKRLPEIASDLNVQYVVEGSVRRSGRDLRITAQLIDATNDAHLWADRYSGTLDDVFEIQDNVTQAIVEGIKVQLTPDEAKRLGKRSFDNPQAYECYLKADHEIWRFNDESINRAAQYLQDAIEMIGDNPVLFAGMAWACFQKVNIGMEQADFIERGKEWAEKALVLDSECPQAHSVLGSLSTWKDYPANHKDANHHFELTLTINPNDADALRGLAFVHVQVGRNDEAERLLLKARRVDPLNSWNDITAGYLHFHGGEYHLAATEWRKAYQADSENSLLQFYLPWAYALDGHRDIALDIFDRNAEANPNNALAKCGLMLMYGLQNDKEQALKEMTSEFRSTCWRDLEWSFNVAAMFALVDARDESLVWLENAVHRGFINYPSLQRMPFLDNLRDEDRFKKLMEWAKYEWENCDI